MALQWNTVAIPFAQGVQPASRARLLDLTRLVRAENCFYDFNNGPQKRPGHLGRAVLTNQTGTPPTQDDTPFDTTLPAPPPPRETYSLANPQLPSNWVFGWGLTSSYDEESDDTSRFHQAGLLFGQAARDNEVLSWDGHRLFSYASEQITNFGQVQDGVPDFSGSTRGPAVMPAMHAEPLAKTPTGQIMPDAADNGVVRTAAWIKAGTTIGIVQWMTTDAVTGAILNLASEDFQEVSGLRVITVGQWTHIVVFDSNAAELKMRSFHQNSPSVIVSRSLGDINNAFDVKKYSESAWVVARDRVAPDIQILFLSADGSTTSSFVPDIGGTTILNLAIAIDKNFNIGLLWSDVATGTVRFRKYTQGGAADTQTTVNNTITTPGRRLTLESTFITEFFGGSEYWQLFVEDIVSGVPRVLSYHATSGAGAGRTLRHTRFGVGLASHAFRVGCRAYVWCATVLPLQSTWYLCDRSLRPVGKLDYGLANTGIEGGYSSTSPLMPSTNWHTTDPEHPTKDHLVWVGCLGYRQRVSTAIAQYPGTPNGVWAEPSIRFYKLDFLPKLRAAQAGRSTYFAGAQLWQYDGLELNEAGFHMAPETWVLTPQNGSGLLQSSGSYQYRIDLCHKNAQNEEVRSWSMVKTVNTGASDNQVSINISHVPMTRREDAYFLVFRTEKNLTSFYLVSSRNPADAGLAANGFVMNDPASASYTFVDRLADAQAAAREYHPANAAGFVEPLGAPACEIVAAGRDRLWLAGGELSPGEVAPSRLFFPGQCPAFSPAINVQVDRGAEPITALGFTGKVAVVFERTAVYTIEGDGPDNLLSGTFFPAQLALSDVGALSQESVVLAAPGLFFQSPAGIRLMSPSGQLLSGASGEVLGTGQDMDPVAVDGDFGAAVVAADDSQIRWYSRDPNKPTLVYDYQSNVWVTWTGVTAMGASYWSPGKTVILTRPDGRLWRETHGHYLDDDRTYDMVIQTAWLRAANAGDFQRFRRMVLFGEANDGLQLRIRYFYNEEPFHREEQTVDFPGDADSQFNTSLWGDGNWNSGSWGDAANLNGQNALWFRNGKFRVRKMPRQQKCSVFSIEFSDQGHTGGGFVPVVLALQLGVKPGLDRVPGAASQV